MSVQGIFRNTKCQRRLIVTKHFNILLQIKIIIAQLLQRGNNRLGSARGIRFGLLVTFSDFQFVSCKRRWEFRCEIFQTGLHGDNLFSHVGCNDCECLARLHILHQLITISASRSHDKWQLILSVKDGIGIYSRRMGIIDSQYICIARGLPESRQRRCNFFETIVRSRYQAHFCRSARNLIRNSDGARLNIRTSHGDGGERKALAKTGFSGSSGHWAGHAVDHDANGGVIGTSIARHLE
mmetsp:Transcript_8212/g.14291  ORF Transcript_8212/g.14291 Transcript_8212/m.14291 type:complete len:239 (-) Transcript_8212:183-899(-)